MDTTFADLVARRQTVLAPSLAQDWPGLPVSGARGCRLLALDGSSYLDFTSGIATVNTGHCHPRVVAAAKEQIDRMIHGALGVTYHESALRLGEALAAVMPVQLDTFFFANSGAEAVEGGLKLARHVTRRPALVAFTGGFHGRTYGAASISTVKAGYRRLYEPFVGSVYFAPYADPFHGGYGGDVERCAADALAALHDLLESAAPPESIAALVVEPIQGEAGFIVPPRSFLAGLRTICDEIGSLLLFDEVQTGFGRTGAMFASQYFDVTPDVMAIGKAVASGFPLSATAARLELMERWPPGSHGTTFGGNPVACAAALATLDVIEDEDLLGNCQRQGQRLLESLRELQAAHPIVLDVRGTGLMIAMELADAEIAMQVLEGCLRRRLLLYLGGRYGQVVRMMPPLCVTSEEVGEALAAVAATLEEVEGGRG